jgi:hypothetical protein
MKDIRGNLAVTSGSETYRRCSLPRQLSTLPGLAAARYRAGLDGARAQFRPRDQVPGGRELGHVQADLGKDVLRPGPADAGDFTEAG